MPRIRKVRVLSAALPITVLILAGTAYADPVLAESMGLDVWEIGRLEKDLKTTLTHGDRLETELLNVQDLMTVNRLIADDVAAGRVELSAAAKRKWDLNRHRAMIRDHLDRRAGGANYEQKTAVDLYERIQYEHGDSSEFVAIGHRLRAEYAAAYHAPMPVPVR